MISSTSSFAKMKQSQCVLVQNKFGLQFSFRVGRRFCTSQQPRMYQARGARKQCCMEQGQQDGENMLPRSSGPEVKISDPVETVAWGGTLPPARRIILGGISATAIALFGNFGGVTSGFLSLDGGQLAEKLKLDVLIPVNGFKRCVDYNFGFEFIYPYRWLADQTIARRAASRLEEKYSPDLPPLRSKPKKEVAEPQVAFGPMGTSGEENISVIVAPIDANFSLQSLGDPFVAGERFLATIAPQGSGKQATLIDASQKTDNQGILYYRLEYIIQGRNFERHNLSVVAAKNQNLFTFNAQCPQNQYEKESGQLEVAASTFKLF